MKLELHIERLTLQGVGRATPEEIAAAVESELARLADVFGLPFAAGRRGIDLPAASIEIAPGSSTAEIGSRIARQLVLGWYRESGSLPPDLGERGEGSTEKSWT